MDECRYQVLFTPKGGHDTENVGSLHGRGIRNFNSKRRAKEFEKAMKEAGYKDVRFWDTLDNSLTGLMKF